MEDEKVLQSVERHDQFQTTEGNQIKLIKTPQGCRIEAIFYGEIGRTKENFLFAYIKINYTFNMLHIMNIITVMED